VKLLLNSLILGGCVLTCRASQEGILPLVSFHLESGGIGASGKVVVDGSQDAHAHLIELKVQAFGKTYVVPADKLALLGDIPSNGVRISYEQGYSDMGGRVVYVQLQMGFTSSTRKDAYVSISEDGTIRVQRSRYNGA
jgi:hypothetical protein